MTTNIQSFAGDVQIDSGNLSVKSLEVKDGVTKLGSNNTAYSNVGVMMTRKDGASNVAFLFTEDGANVVLGYTNDDALEGDRIDILQDEKANLVVYGNVYVSGSVHGDGSTLTGLVTTLQSVTEFGAETDQTILFTNQDTGINVSSNVLVSGNVTANVFFGDGGLLSNITQTLEGITAIGNTTTYTIEFNNTHTSFVTVSNTGIGNALPTADLCVGANVVIDDESLDKISVSGNIACDQLNLGSIEILPAYSLENVTQIGNTTTNVMSFKNTTLAFDTDKMAGIGIIPSSADVGTSGLHVDGHLRLGGAADNTDEEQMYVKAAGALGILANESDTDNTNTALRLQTGDTNNSNITMIGKSSAQYMTFGTNAAEKMRITADGKVGVGTANPGAQSEIYGQGQTSTETFDQAGNMGGVLAVKSSDNSLGSGGAVMFGSQNGYHAAIKASLENGNDNTSGRLGFYTRNVTTDSTMNHVMTISDEGRLGIGTTAPAYTLDVSGTSNVGALNATNVLASNVYLSARGDNVDSYGTSDNAGGPWYGLGFDTIVHPGANKTYPQNVVQVSGYYGVNFRTGYNFMTLNEYGRFGFGNAEPYGHFDIRRDDENATTSTTTHLKGHIAIGNSDSATAQGNCYVTYSGRGTSNIVNASTFWKSTGGYYGTYGYFGIAVNDASTGLSDQYGITQGEVDAQTHLVINHVGRVGIGTTLPYTKLHLLTTESANTGDTEDDFIGSHDTTEMLRMTGNGNTSDVNNVSAAFAIGGDYPAGGSSPHGRLDIYTNNGADAGNSYGWTPDNLVASFRGDGRLGISTSVPKSQIDFSGVVMGRNASAVYSHNLYYDAGSTTWRYATAGDGGAFMRMENSEIAFWTAADANASADQAVVPTQKVTILANGTILSDKGLAPSGAGSTPLYDLDDDEAKLLLYKNSYENWAGLGCDTGGRVWLKAGTAGQGGYLSVNSAGRVGVGTCDSLMLFQVSNRRATPTLYYSFDSTTGIGSGTTLTLPGDVTFGSEMYSVNPNWKKVSVAIITYDNANTTDNGTVYIYCHGASTQPTFTTDTASSGYGQFVVDVNEHMAVHIKPVSGVTLRVTSVEWFGKDSGAIIQGHSLDCDGTDPSSNYYAQLEIASAARALGSTAGVVHLQLGADYRGGGTVGCGFIQGINDYIYKSPVCIQPAGGRVGFGTSNPQFADNETWGNMSLVKDAYKVSDSNYYAGQTINFHYGGNSGEINYADAIIRSYSWMDSNFVMKGGLGFSVRTTASDNGTVFMFMRNNGFVGFGIGTNEARQQVEIGATGYFQLFLRNTTTYDHGWGLGVENSASNTLVVYPAYKSGGSSGGVFIRDSNTAWSGNSDERLKEDITQVTNCLDKIKNVRPVTFHWKGVAEKPSQKNIGFIAQDWKDVVPEVVSTHPHHVEDLEDCLTMNMVGTIPVVCGAVQELNAKVDEHIENKNLHVSDKRIKTAIVDVEDASALESFRLLQPKRYEYLDKEKNGSDVVWGFLAQDVKEAVSYATTTKTGYIPNIQEYSNISGNVMTFTNFSTSNLESNALVLQVRDILGNFHDVHINEIIDDTSVRIADDLSSFTGSYDTNGNVVTYSNTHTITKVEYEKLFNTFGYAPREILSYTSNVIVSYSSNTATHYDTENDVYYTENEYDALINKSNVVTTYEIVTVTKSVYDGMNEEKNLYNIENWEESTISTDEYDNLTETERNDLNLTPNIDYYVKTTTEYPGDLLYVYGQRVDDFVYLKKDAIWTLTTAALQEVDRQLQAEKVKVATLETQMADLLARVQALEN